MIDDGVEQPLQCLLKARAEAYWRRQCSARAPRRDEGLDQEPHGRDGGLGVQDRGRHHDPMFGEGPRRGAPAAATRL
jgi:hypothetical protein